MTATKRFALTALLVVALGLMAAAALQWSRAQQEPERQSSDRASLTVTVEPADALVGVAGPNGYLTFYPADSAGEQALSDLEPGSYIVVATAEGYASERIQIDLAAGERVGTTLTLVALGDGAGGEQNQQNQSGQQNQNEAGGGHGNGEGGQIFAQNCAQCHGQQGGGGSGPALAGNQDLQDAQAVTDQIREGGGGMPSFGGQLSDEQIAAVASFVRTSWGNDFGTVEGGGQQNQNQQPQNEQNQAGQQNQQPQQNQAGQQDGGQQEGTQQNQQAQQDGAQQDGTDAAGGQPEVQVRQEDGGVRIEITLRQGGGAPVIIDLRIGLDAAAGGGSAPAEQANQQAQPQQNQAGQQNRQNQQNQNQPGQGQQASQSCRQDGEGAADAELLGTLEIAWVEPAGTTVVVTGPEGCRDELQIVGGTVLTELAPGSYVVTATRPGFESAGAETEVAAGQTAVVTLDLHPQQGQQVQSHQQTQQNQTQQNQTQQNAPAQTGDGGRGGDGAQIFAQNCAQCHGQQGGGGSGPALAGNQDLQDAQAVTDQIREGGGGMPSFGGQLSDEQIAAVASFVRTSWGNDFGAVEGAQGGGQNQDQQNQQTQNQAGQQTQNQQTQNQPGQGQQSGWFSQAQAQSGFEEYSRHCAVCHGSGLEGRAGYPGLVGDEFLATWRGRTVAALFEYVSTKMPQDRPGTLGHPTYTDITAYILAQNGFPAGGELDAESGRAEEQILTAPGAGTGGEGGQAPGTPPGQ